MLISSNMVGYHKVRDFGGGAGGRGGSYEKLRLPSWGVNGRYKRGEMADEEGGEL